MALLQVGSKAPDFTVNDQDGNAVSLSDFKGRKIVLYFYPQDLTETCTKQACNLRDNYTSLQRKGYEILGVSTDSEKKHKKFIVKEKLPFRLLADTDRKLHDLYGTWAEKFTFGRHYMGTLRTTYIIDEKGVISNVIEKVVSGEHTAQIIGNAPESGKSTAPLKEGKKPTIKKK
jgi:thioredoxin-dependent peroxiredoxin